MSEDATLDEFVSQEEAEEQEETNEWVRLPISNISEWTDAGGTPRTSNNEYWGGSIPWVQTGELTKRHIRSTEKHITELGLEESTAKQFPPGTLLVGMYGEPTVGESALLEIEATTNQACCGILPDRDVINAEFLHQTMQYEKPRLYSLRAGSGQQNIRQGIIRKFEINVPSLSEQRKIATVLYTVDQAIEKTEEIREQIKQSKKSVAQDLIHTGIGGQGTKSAWMGEIPTHWNVRDFSEIIEFSRNGIYKDEDSYGGPYPIIKMGDIFGGVVLEEPIAESVYLDDGELDKYEAIEGDLVFARHAQAGWGAGDCTYVPDMDERAVVESNMVQVRLTNEVEPLFYAQYFNNEIGVKSMKRITTTGNIKGISQGDLMNLKVPVPPKQEQMEIAKTLSSFDNLSGHSESEAERLRRLKRGLMQDLLSGTVRTTDTNIDIPDEIAQHG